MSKPKYPNIELQLAGRDGNAFSILGRAAKAMRKAGLSQDEIEAYRTEATQKDYDHLLVTTMRWFECH